MRTYPFGEIPPQEIWLDGQNPQTRLDFEIESEPGKTYAYSATPRPNGSVNLVGNRFSYVPSIQDVSPFVVSFTQSQAGQDSEAQRVVITPIPLPDVTEAGLISQAAPIPPETDYLIFGENRGTTAKPFNRVEQPTRTVNIVAKRLVFNEADENGLLTRINGSDTINSDIEELFIYADSIQIDTPLRFPQTRVTIYAQKLSFSASGSISTVPATFDKASQFANGKTGNEGGDLTLRVGQLDLGNPGIVRFITRGAKGQAAGEGRDGDPISPLGVVLGGPAKGGISQYAWDRAIYFVIVTRENGGETYQKWGDEYVRPSNGNPATPAGAPGPGGKGGNISCNLAIAPAQMNLAGGASGDKAADRVGGPAQFPSPAFHIREIVVVTHTGGGGEEGPRTSSRSSYDEYRRFDTANGADAPAPALAPAGDPGTFQLVNGADASWVHPYIVQAVVAHTRDLYINGDLLECRDILEAWLERLATYQAPDNAPDLQVLAEKYRMEMRALLHRISSNQDYFGNPAGWVPMLSLEANFINYKEAVEEAMKTLYLSYWVSARTRTKQESIAAMREAVRQADSDIKAASDEYEKIQNLLPGLESQNVIIQQKLATITAALARKEAELEARARDNVEDRHSVPFWKQSLRVLGTVCKVIPVYQPALAAVGTGLELIANVDTTKPMNTINGIKDLSSEFSSEKLQQSRQNLDNLVHTLNRRNSANNQEYVKGLVEVGKKFGDAISAIEKATRTTQVPQTEIEAELKRIEDSDTVFQELVAQVRELTQLRYEFAQKLESSLQTVASFTTRLTTSIIAVNELNHGLADAQEQIDHRSLLQIKEMEQRAKDTLVEFQYYLAKAYEYRMLKPYPVDYRVNTTVEKLRDLVALPDKAAVLSPEDFDMLKEVYKASSRTAVVEGLRELEQRPPSRSQQYPFGLTDEEVAELNLNGSVFINLKDKVAPLSAEENRRIVEVGIEEIQSEPLNANIRTANVTITVEHQGPSVIRSGFKFYYFNHRSNVPYAPFTWGANYDALRSVVSPSGVSDDSLSLTRNLLGIRATDAQMTTFARPGADGLIKITRESTTRGLEFKLTQMRLWLKVDFFRGSGGTVLLDVSASGGLEADAHPQGDLQEGNLLPYITCSTPDLGNRKDGRGSFTRIYRQNDIVKLVAPLTFGALTFKKWVNEVGLQLVDKPELELRLQSSKNVQAIYEKDASNSPTPLLLRPLDNLREHGDTLNALI